MTQVPIKLQENVQLQSHGITQASIGFASVSMDSDKYVCVCAKGDQSSQVVIFEIADPSKISKYPMSADSARMNPTSNIIALKAGKSIQVYDADKKVKIKSFALPYEVGFWKWVSSSVIVLVTDNSIYHWNTVDASEAPEKVFDRHESLRGCQIISYKVDSSLQWMALVGISAQSNRVAGAVQLYSVGRGISQNIEGHACCFCQFTCEDNSVPSNVFVFAFRGVNGSKLNMIEVGAPPSGSTPFPKKSVEIFFPPEASTDFPVAIHSDNKCGIVYVVTKMGYVHLFEVGSGICFFANRISNDVIFATADLNKGGGFVGVNRAGQVLTVSTNGDQIVSFLQSRNMEEIGIKIAERGGLLGAESAFLARFNQYISQHMYSEAAKIVTKSPGGALRSPQMLAIFQSAPSSPGQPSPILTYFGALLENGKLTAFESVELCKPVVQQGKKALIEKWLLEDKLECSEELGDIVKGVDMTLSLSIYLRGNCHQKVVQCFSETGQFQKILLYCKKVDYKADYVAIIRSLSRSYPDASLQFAKSLVSEDIQGVDIKGIANVFVETNQINHCTAFLLEALKTNLPEHADLQTKLLEMNIMSAPQVADAIFANGLFTHFDKQHIAKLCEQSGLTQRALELYTDIYDIKRAVVQTHLLNIDWLVGFFGSLSVDDSLSCLNSMLEYNLRQNLQAVVQVSVKYHDQLNTNALIKMFENFKSSEGLFLFLSAIVNYSQDADVHFKYIQAACKTGQIKEVERICKESNCYDPEKTKNFLKEAKLTDQLPLIIVCDRFDFVHDLVLHLYKNNHMRYIEIFVQRVNPARLPEIVGALLDVNCGEDVIRNMINSCPLSYSLDKLVEEVSKRNRIKLIMPLLESRIASGSTESAVHTALAIVYIDSNNRPEQFLRDNSYYDSLIVGQYCEKRDCQLACIAYEKGGNDDELIRVCCANALYKNLARYLIFRRDASLWSRVLVSTNEHRRSIIDQVVQSALSDTYEPECVSEMVKAFMAAELPNELIEVLEKLVLTNSRFSGLKNLQNLLFLTAIKADPSRLVEYVNRLDNYDAPNIASVAISSKLYEEAFAIYKKFEVHSSAVQVLVEHIKSIDRAYEYCERCNDRDAWGILAKAQLSKGLLKEAIDSFIKSGDSSSYMEVIDHSRKTNNYDNLLRYLTMARATIRDGYVDSEYAFCMAATGQNDKLEEFLGKTHNISIIQTGERCFDAGLYLAAKVIFIYANNYPKLATTYVKLNDCQAAVECARKANNTKTWKEVCFVCVTSGEFRFAQICALNIVIHPEELEELIVFYEEQGLFNELIALIEASVGLERAHMGIFTELAILYSKYKTSRLKEHLELFWTRVNIPKVIRSAEASHLWAEMVYLYDKYEEYDNAILTIIRHPGTAFQDSLFRDIIPKVANAELYYKAISFYMEFRPLSLHELLLTISSRVDHSRCISQLKSLGVLALGKNYLLHVQKLNIAPINEALNSILIEEEAYDELRSSITSYSNFDALSLAQTLENHSSVEFRRIANTIYKTCNRWEQSINLAKKDGLHMDAVMYAAESQDSGVALSLMDHFIELKRPDYVVALLYTCYDILSPVDVLERCWINGMTDYCMPYLIQLLQEYTNKINSMSVKQKESEDSKEPENNRHMVLSNTPQLMLGAPQQGYFGPSQGSQPNLFNQPGLFGSSVRR